MRDENSDMRERTAARDLTSDMCVLVYFVLRGWTSVMLGRGCWDDVRREVGREEEEKADVEAVDG